MFDWKHTDINQRDLYQLQFFNNFNRNRQFQIRPRNPNLLSLLLLHFSRNLRIQTLQRSHLFPLKQQSNAQTTRNPYHPLQISATFSPSTPAPDHQPEIPSRSLRIRHETQRSNQITHAIKFQNAKTDDRRERIRRPSFCIAGLENENSRP